MKTLLSCFAALTLLGACNLAPDYSRPSVTAPDTFKESAAPTPPASVSWTQAHPRDDANRTKWWLPYGDPILDQLEERVSVSNQTLQADAAAYAESRALVEEAHSALFPTITATPAITHSRPSQTLGGSTGSNPNDGTPGPPSGGGGGTLYSLPVAASYDPDFWGQLHNTMAVNSANAQASAGDLATARLSLQAQLAQDYFQVRALDAERTILDSTATTYLHELDLTRQLYADGIDSEEDILQAQAQWDTATAQATDLGNARAQYEHAIAVLMGQAPATFTLAVTEFNAVPPPIPPVLPSQLLERRPDIAAAERRVAAANAQLGVARAAYYPSLSLSAAAGFESSQASRLLTAPSFFWSLGAQLSETILDFGYRQGENDQARAAYTQAVATYRQTVLSGFQAVEDNLAALRILTTEVAQRQSAVVSSQRYATLEQARFQSGIDSYLNVNTAQTMALTTEENAVTTHLQLMQASVALILALGGGWEAADLPP